jgi:hypothetical protein
MRARLSLPMQDDLTAMLDRATKRGEIPPPADAQAALALIVAPLYCWLLSGDTITPATVETLVPMLLRALQATGSGSAPTLSWRTGLAC